MLTALSLSDAASSMSRVGWLVGILVVSCAAGLGVAGYVFYKYRLRVYSSAHKHFLSLDYMVYVVVNELSVSDVHGLGDHGHHVPVHAARQPEQRAPAPSATCPRSLR